MKKILSMICALALTFSLFVPNIVKANDNQTISAYAANATETLLGTAPLLKEIGVHYFEIDVSVFAEVYIVGNVVSSVRSVGSYYNYARDYGIYASNIETEVISYSKGSYYVDVNVKVTYDILTQSTGNYLYTNQSSTKTVRAE